MATWLPKSQFVFIKATEGKGYDAPAYAHQVSIARGVSGLHVGAYHYAWPENGWELDFNHFVAIAGLKVGEAGILDFEPWSKTQPLADPKTFPAYVVGWVNAYKARFGVDPLFYAPDFFVSQLKQYATPDQWARISGLPFMKAGVKGVYVSSPDAGPGSSLGFQKIAAWQWTDTPLDQDILYVPWTTIAVVTA